MYSLFGDSSYGDYSNGDTVHVTWNIDSGSIKQFKKLYGLNIKADDIYYQVTGLEEIAKEDAFANLKVTFVGTDGKAYATVSGGEDDLYYYIPSSSSRLSRGDEVTVEVCTMSGSTRIEDFVKAVGYAPKELSKTYIVDGFSKIDPNWGDLDSLFE